MVHRRAAIPNKRAGRANDETACGAKDRRPPGRAEQTLPTMTLPPGSCGPSVPPSILAIRDGQARLAARAGLLAGGMKV
jgi:hypothetical protein